MKISLGCQSSDIALLTKTNGFGYATDRMITSLERLGHSITTNDKNASVEIWFEQPHNITWSSQDMYRICYVPWESTALPTHKGYRSKSGQTWQEVMNGADEVWTPSPLIAEWFKEFCGITVPIFVYEHGVDPIWQPHQRTIEDKFKFLHVGAEALRKGGRETMRAFRHAFPNNNDVELNLKISSDGWQIGRLSKINIYNRTLRLTELIDMFHDNHVFVYPSFGEGFGLTPLQALATGMPTITVPAWAPYARFLDPSLSLSSKAINSPWPQVHPGKVLEPNEDELIDRYRHAYENYDTIQSTAHAQVDQIMAFYDWDRLTKEMFDALEKRLQNS